VIELTYLWYRRWRLNRTATAAAAAAAAHAAGIR